ncbi:hypothetical protein GCM10027429_34040 [Marivirga atlantica]|uniref:Uncharacterized protein n=1 Tax=Marivirga atlantica TaxID=1548457 RepID=A0A937DKJ1_9BACT|nr:hypothetical protein [Marivirga atlantica]MBL0766985.1 hypothetical protein [Marivirga atlantica]
MKKQFILYLALITSLTNCTTLTTTRTVDIDPIVKYGVISEPIIAEVKIGEEKVVGEYSIKNRLFNSNKEYAENMAISDAIQKVDADYMVQPTFDIQRKQKLTTVKVEGFPGYYEKFRPMEAADTAIFKYGNQYPQANIIEPSTVQEDVESRRQRRKLGIITGSVVLATLLLLITGAF